MAIQRNDIRDRVWLYLKSIGMTDYGAAGMMGNLFSESSIDPSTVEALLVQRYNEDGKSEYLRPVNTQTNIKANNKTYTAAVDNGSISHAEFLRPRKKHYGYGIAQWTSDGRKQKLWNNTKGEGKSISDLDGQLKTLKEELEDSYKSVFDILKSATSIEAASDAVLTKYEQPSNADMMKSTRRNYSRQIYDLYHNKEVTTVSYDIVILTGMAEGEIGYCEKKSNSQLDSKTSNAGKNNYTKYWRDLDPSYQGQPWCDAFVDWCFINAYGLDAAQKLECGGCKDYYTPSSAQHYKNKGQWHTSPKVGDQIFFKNSSRICHTGIVVGVGRDTVTTIEGNTSPQSGVVESNGGEVCRKSYKLNNSRIAGYGRPNYGTQSKTTGGGYTVTLKEIKNGSSGNDVLLLQEILRARKFDTQVIGEELALDHEFGPKTEKVVKWYQKQRNLSVDGIVGPNTWRDLLGM